MEGQALHLDVKARVHSRASKILGSDNAQAPQYGFVPNTGHDGGDFLFVPKEISIPIRSSAPSSDRHFIIRGDLGGFFYFCFQEKMMELLSVTVVSLSGLTKTYIKEKELSSINHVMTLKYLHLVLI